MEPILSKKEIASLLTALREGTISLSDEEAKFQELKKQNATPVNLFNQTKFDREQVRIPNFDIIVDVFCRMYTTSLTNQLQRTFNIRRSSMETIKFEEFMASQGNSGAIGVFDLKPLPTGALVIFDPHLSFSILEIMLGAAIDIESPMLERRLTTLELNILKSPVTEICPDLSKAFAQLMKINPTMVKLENNARLISIAKPDEEVIVATLQVVIRQEIGKIHMLFPITTLDPLREQLKELLKISSQKGSTWKDVFVSQIQRVPLEITAKSGEMTMTVRDILAMEVGDVLEINYDPNLPLQVLVEECHKFNAIAGTHNGNKAISLVGAVE